MGRLSIGRGLKRLTWVLSLLPPLATVVLVVAMVIEAAWSGRLYPAGRVPPDHLDITVDRDSPGKQRPGSPAGFEYRVKVNGKSYTVVLDRPADSPEELEKVVREEITAKGLGRQFLDDASRGIILFFAIISGAWFVVCWTVYFTARWVARGFTPRPDSLSRHRFLCPGLPFATGRAGPHTRLAWDPVRVPRASGQGTRQEAARHIRRTRLHHEYLRFK